MNKKIITHPENVKYIKELFHKIDDNERERDKDFIHFINPFPFGISIVTNEHMEKERWTGKWLVKQDRFSTYWDGKGEPASWAIYFGFVVKEMEPNFYEVEEPSMFRTYMDFGSFAMKDNRRFLFMNAGV